MAGSILGLLAEHRSLAYEQIAAMVAEPPDAVRRELERLRDAGLVDVLAVGHLKGSVTNATSYWRLSAAGAALVERAASN
jgi:DNA-binding transcriptional ArsR family regulator